MNCPILEVSPRSEVLVGGKVAGRISPARGGYKASVKGIYALGASEREAAVAALVKSEWMRISAPIMKAAEKARVEGALIRAAYPNLFN